MRTYSCTHSNIDIITKLATTQNLPQIKITSFDGNALEWLNFVVQFKEIIHEQPNLSGSQPMTYLRQCLAKDARKCIFGLYHDWSGYVTGLKCLKLLYGQRSYIVTAHIGNVVRGSRIEDSGIGGLTVLYYSINDCTTALLRLN